MSAEPTVTLATTIIFSSRPMSCPLPHTSYSPIPSRPHNEKPRLQPYIVPAPDNTSYLYSYPSTSAPHTPPYTTTSLSAALTVPLIALLRAPVVDFR
jgi:hypothetical protein